MDRPEESSPPRGLLQRIERIGNALPDPATLFLIGAVLVLGLSHLGAIRGWSAILPQSGETIEVTSLLSTDGFRWVWLNLVDNFTGFAPLGLVLVAMLGIGVAERSGLVQAGLQLFVRWTPPSLITPGILFAGIMSSLAADAGFVVLPPLAAAIFARLGRPPLVGIALTYAGVAGGFSANLLVTSLDPMLVGATQQAATLLAPDTYISVTSNYYFLVVSTLVITVVGWVVTVRVVEPRFSRSDIEQQIAAGALDLRAQSSEPSGQELRGLIAAGLALLSVVAMLLSLVLLPNGPLHGTIELRSKVEVPVWSQGIVPMLFLGFVAPGLAYGVATGSVRSDRAVARMMSETLATMSSYIVLAFFCGQFVAWFAHSGLGTIFAIWGIEALADWNLPWLGLVLAIIGLTAVLNLFIGSASAKWFLLAPVFVPLFLGLGISPELTQAAYRVGDSATNTIAPLNPYIVVILAYLRRYAPDAGIGTVMSLMLPYSMTFLLVWTGLLLLWVGLGIPLGMGNGPLFVEPPGALQ